MPTSSSEPPEHSSQTASLRHYKMQCSLDFQLQHDIFDLNYIFLKTTISLCIPTQSHIILSIVPCSTGSLKFLSIESNWFLTQISAFSIVHPRTSCNFLSLLFVFFFPIFNAINFHFIIAYSHLDSIWIGEIQTVTDKKSFFFHFSMTFHFSLICMIWLQN